MERRNLIGLVLLVLGVILQPVGWMYVFWVQMLSFALIGIGVVVFITQKCVEKLEDGAEGRGGYSRGAGMPGDVYDHGGWGRGGRSDSWSSGGGDGGD